MKKNLFTLIIMASCTLVAFAFGTRSMQVDGVSSATPPADDGDDGKTGGKMLLIYFSRAGENWQVGYVERGNTAVMVDYISELADIDVFEIVSATEYPSSYNEMLDVATAEFNDDARPEYVGDIDNIDDYQTVFIGGPIWWGRPPMIFRTFFESHPELDGKTIVPFGTHGGSGVGSYATLIRSYFPNATILESLGIAGANIRNDSSKDLVEAWLHRLGLDRESTNIETILSKKESNNNEYSLSGTRMAGKGIYIKNNKKFIRR